MSSVAATVLNDELVNLVRCETIASHVHHVHEEGYEETPTESPEIRLLKFDPIEELINVPTI